VRPSENFKEQSAYSDPWPWGWPGVLVVVSALLVGYLLISLALSEYHLARQGNGVPCLKAGGHLGPLNGCWIELEDGTKVRVELGR